MLAALHLRVAVHYGSLLPGLDETGMLMQAVTRSAAAVTLSAPDPTERHDADVSQEGGTARLKITAVDS